MPRTKLYRSCVITGLVAAAATLVAGCADAGKTHATIKEQQYNQWNMTRVEVMYQLAKQQYEVRDYDKCMKTLQEALAFKAPFAGLHTLSAKVSIEKGALEAAQDELEKSIRINSNDPEPYYLMGVVYQRWQKPEVACGYYEQAWERKPSEPLYLLAVAEMKITTGKLDEAQKMLEAKLVYFDQTAAVRIALAKIATLKGDHAAACKYYREAVLLLPDDETVRRSYAEALFYAKKYSDAVPIFEDMRQKTDTPDRENLLVMLGEAYLALNRPFDSRNAFQEVTRDHSENADAYLGLGRACIQTNASGIALAAARKVMRDDPTNRQAVMLAALVQQRQNKWSDAMATLQPLIQGKNPGETALCMMGVSAEKTGNKEAAIGYFEKAVDLKTGDTWAQELLEKVRGPAPQAAAPADAPVAPLAPVLNTEPTVIEGVAGAAAAQ